MSRTFHCNEWVEINLVACLLIRTCSNLFIRLSTNVQEKAPYCSIWNINSHFPGFLATPTLGIDVSWIQMPWSENSCQQDTFRWNCLIWASVWDILPFLSFQILKLMPSNSSLRCLMILFPHYPGPRRDFLPYLFTWSERHGYRIYAFIFWTFKAMDVKVVDVQGWGHFDLPSCVPFHPVFLVFAPMRSSVNIWPICLLLCYDVIPSDNTRSQEYYLIINNNTNDSTCYLCMCMLWRNAPHNISCKTPKTESRWPLKTPHYQDIQTEPWCV